MPTSWIENIPIIVKGVLAIKPERILDLGMGSGKYGFLIREQTDFFNNRVSPDSWKVTIDGVEAYKGYINTHQRAVYNKIFCSEAITFLKGYNAEEYDCALAIDIIEHFSPLEGIEFVKIVRFFTV